MPSVVHADNFTCFAENKAHINVTRLFPAFTIDSMMRRLDWA